MGALAISLIFALEPFGSPFSKILDYLQVCGPIPASDIEAKSNRIKALIVSQLSHHFTSFWP
jgi:hypothetical protein